MKTRLLLLLPFLLLTSCSGQPLSHLTWAEITIWLYCAALLYFAVSAGQFQGQAKAQKKQIKQLNSEIVWLRDELTAVREDPSGDVSLARLHAVLGVLRKGNSDSTDAAETTANNGNQ